MYQVTQVFEGKKCTKCNEIKVSTEFYLRKNRRDPDSLRSWCKACCNLEDKAAYRKNKDTRKIVQDQWKKRNPLKLRNYKLRQRYGISLEVVDELKEQQHNRCAICDRATTLVVDHCHETGNIRGLLCSTCNQGIGLLKDDPEICVNAARYLRKNGKV